MFDDMRIRGSFHRRIAISIVLLILAGLGRLDAQAVRIFYSRGQADLPHIITMKNGDLMVVFNDGTDFSSDSHLLYMIYSQETGIWSEPRQAVPRRESSAYPQLAMDDEGDIHMVYMEGFSSSYRDIFYAMYSNSEKKWSEPRLAYSSPGVTGSWPRIQVEGDMIFIAWSIYYLDTPGLEWDICMIANRKGDAWPVTGDLRKNVSNTGPAVSIHCDFAVRNKTVYAVWMDTFHLPGTGFWKLYYNEGTYKAADDDWHFPDSLYLHPEDHSEYYPALTVDPSGTVHVLYSFKSGPHFHIMKKPGGQWTAPKAVSPNLTHQNVFAYLRYHDGLIHALWRESAADGEAVIYARALPDGTWATPIPIGTGLREAGFPWMTIDGKDDAHVVWSDGPDDIRRDIYYVKVRLPGNAPQAVIDADPIRGNIPLSVRFDGSRSADSDGTIQSYQWDFGDGNTAEGRTVTHTYTRKGSYTATLRIVDNDFKVGRAGIMIVVSIGEPTAVIKASATRGVVPMRVEFDGSESYDEDGRIDSYEWSFGDGNTAVGPLVAHTYMMGGLYQARLTVTDNDGKTHSATVKMEVFQEPKAVFTAVPTRGRIPLEVVFDASESVDEDGRIVSYRWSFGDGFSGEGVTVAHTYTTDGPHTARLTVTDNDGYEAAASAIIKALGKPAPPTDIAVKTEINRALLFRDVVNRVSWNNSPDNEGLFTIAQYRIYRKLTSDAAGQFVKVGEVSATQLHFDDRKHASVQDAARYEYVVTAVDNQGRESAPSLRVSTGGNS